MPFDHVTNATKISCDDQGMFFSFDAEDLSAGRTYVMDILVDQGGTKTHYHNASAVFRIDSTQDQT
jgi:hypothetical protein